MELWEELGMTEDEYNQAMEEMHEAMGPFEPTDEELADMHMSGFNDMVRGGWRPRDVYEWIEVEGAYDESVEYPHLPSAGLVGNSLDAIGYTEKSGMDRGVWIESEGRKVAARDGMSWVGIRATMGQTFEEQPFDRMLEYRQNRDYEWSDSDNELLNQKIVDEWRGICADYEAGMQNAESGRWLIDEYERRRESDGIQGDEPDIPWYIARDHGFGKSREELEAEADGEEQSVENTYEISREDFFNRVYDTGMQFQHLDAGISRRTYEELGDEYAAFCDAKTKEYAREKAALFGGIDLTKSAKVVEVPVKVVETRKPYQKYVPGKFDEILNSVENGVSNDPDYDFDEYDGGRI